MLIPHGRRTNGRLEQHAASMSGRRAVLIFEKPAQALASGDAPDFLADLRTRLQDLVIQSLVRSFAMVMQ